MPAARLFGGGPAGPSTRSYHPTPTESKASFGTTELVAHPAAVVSVLLAPILDGSTDDHEDCPLADEAWSCVTLLTSGYLGIRGLAESGSREHDDAR